MHRTPQTAYNEAYAKALYSMKTGTLLDILQRLITRD